MDRLEGKTILVADADAAAREAVSAEFRAAGCEVFAAGGGTEAYEIVRDNAIHAVVSSERLTDGDPVLLLADIRRIHHDIPVVLYGAPGSTTSQGEALNRGFAAHCRRADPASALVSAVSRCLEFVSERYRKRVERTGVVGRARFTFGQPPLTVTAPVLNLGKGGMFLSLENNFPPQGSMVVFQVSFSLDKFETSIEGVAVVRWVRELPRPGMMPGVGLEFSVLSQEAESALKGYLARSSKLPAPKVS